MSSVTKFGSGYRAQVYVKGTRDSQTFRTKREADAWASARETELRENATKPPGELHTLRVGLLKYQKEEAPKKRDSFKEAQRIERLLESKHLPHEKLIAQVSETDMAGYRDARLAVRKKGTALREIGVLSAFFETARKEWKWITINPVENIAKPKKPKHRDRIIKKAEIKAMLRSMGYRRGVCETMSQRAAYAFLIALRTGMRAGEICAMQWGDFHGDYVHVASKTDAGDRDVPLSKKARRYFAVLKSDQARIVGIASATLDTYFRDHRTESGLSGFTFHDSRHTAATWIGRAGKINVLDMCKAFGWTDPKVAMVYYNPTASDMAKLL